MVDHVKVFRIYRYYYDTTVQQEGNMVSTQHPLTISLGYYAIRMDINQSCQMQSCHSGYASQTYHY